MKLGPMLRQARVKAGMSQEEIAPLLYLPRSSVSKIENDKVELKARDLIRWFQITQAPEIAAALLCGVDIAIVTQLLTALVGGFITLLL